MTRIDADASAVEVVIAVPPGTRRPEPLIAAINAVHPGWTCLPVWAGDPHLRPRLSDGRAWLDVEVDEGDLLRVDPDGLTWLVALTAAIDRRSDSATVVIVAGAAVLGPLTALVPAPGELVVVPRLLDAPVASDHFPTLDQLAEDGAMSAAVAAFGAGSRDAARWIRDRLIVPSRDQYAVPIGRLLELAAGHFESDACTDETVAASVWRWPDTEPALLDLPGYEPEAPHLADASIDGPPRISLDTPRRQAAVERAGDQLHGSTEPLRLPGGLEIDTAIRRVARAHRDLPARPWSDASAFRSWLHEQYWDDVYVERGDLQAIFPYRTGLDADRFATWARRAAADGDAPLMIDPDVFRSTSKVQRRSERRDGVDLVGYFKHQSGVANIGRTVAAILGRHGVPHSTVAYERTWSPPITPEPTTDQRLEYASSIAFVNADQFGHLRSDLPDLFGADRTVAGMWFWELERFEGGLPAAPIDVDQIWSMTEFMVAPFSEVGAPVHHVRVPIARPAPSDQPRSSFAPLADADGRFVFGVVLDHLSVTARKNPLGAITAFRRAFPQPVPDGPMLVVKTINARAAWQEQERLRFAAAGRSDIVIWDELLPLVDHHALIGSFDALVSLHRSEGAGLHLAEAMWMQVPVIATGYSGNLDVMDTESSMLIDHHLVEVGPGLAPYPPHSVWASPDLDQAADAMRRLVDDPDHAARIGAAALAKMQSLPGEAEFVEQIVGLLGIERS